ncbi:hypothetical protein TNCT_398941 [Trichonephila clavata]|uniref:Uncharacterized protein n=1 Tax=Trichonephila clavata TaxID=2740835 RepID=A0A8X6LRI5_TRICU|nr:hypothetical protein TNCT_398941 [Trichonephila clavata]
MVDGEICRWLAHSSSKSSHLFYSKPKSMNDLEAMKTRQIVTEKRKLGIFSLHAWIKHCDCLLHPSYRLDIRKWLVRKADKHVVDARK